nr:hypothetical protein [Tanacetum cinerariifolium]
DHPAQRRPAADRCAGKPGGERNRASGTQDPLWSGAPVRKDRRGGRGTGAVRVLPQAHGRSAPAHRQRLGLSDAVVDRRRRRGAVSDGLCGPAFQPGVRRAGLQPALAVAGPDGNGDVPARSPDGLCHRFRGLRAGFGGPGPPATISSRVQPGHRAD